MGRTDLDPAIVGEGRYAQQVCADLRRLGLDAEVIGDPERPSVVADARVPGARDTVLVASHLDTVPVDGMEIDPFDPSVEGDRVYGRGACDTKGGMAALVSALERVLARGTLRRNVIAVGESDEERSSIGVFDVLRHLEGRPPAPGIWGIATEPTNLSVVTRHKGVAHARVAAHGHACHSSDPTQGRNAIVTAARAILVIDALGVDLAACKDPELGPATLSIGLVSGGSATNVVPARASFVIDRRLIPGESGEGVRMELEAALEQAGIRDVEIEACDVRKAPLVTPDDHPAVRACLSALGAAGLEARTGAVAFGTDAGVLAEHGIPGVVLGPGSILQAHTAREWVDMREVASMEEVFVKLFEAEA